MKNPFKILTLLLSVFCMNATAQMKSDFKIIADTTEENATIYQGQCTFEDLGKINEFSEISDASAFFNDDAAIEYLSQHLPDYSIAVLLGTWCEDSQHLLPPFYEVIRKTSFPLERLQLIALDREKKGALQEEQKYSVTNVPTFIFFKDGKEAGRITESVTVDVLQDIRKIIADNE